VHLFRQRHCVDGDALALITAKDLAQLRCLCHDVASALATVDYIKCPDGADYAVPWPGFPGLFRTVEDRDMHLGLYRHQLASLHAMHGMENSSRAFGALRGGILADAPGLGKTVTTLALIVSTGGVRPTVPRDFWDASSIAAGWAKLRCALDSRADILRSLRTLRQLGDCFPRKSLGCEAIRQVLTAVQPPFAEGCFETMGSFKSFVAQQVKSLPLAPREMSEVLEEFRRGMVDLCSRMDPRNRKLLASSEGQRLRFERSLLSSSATLVVVPDALLEHWFEQVRRHLGLPYFADTSGDASGRGIVHLDGLGDVVDIRVPLSPVSLVRPMERPGFLAGHLLVITTFSRCRAEFDRCCVDSGSVVGGGAGGRSRRRRGGSKQRQPRERQRAAAVAPPRLDPSKSPLLQLRWLRLVVDEGHELGQHQSSSATTALISEIAAERRWVLSGTPTTGDEETKDFTSSGLAQIQRLLRFLRHPQYGQSSALVSQFDSAAMEQDRLDLEARWKQEVAAPFLGKEESGRVVLADLLRSLMVHHRKEDLELPRPIFRNGEVAVTVPPYLLELVDGKVGLMVDTPAAVARQRRREADWHEALQKSLGNLQFQTEVDSAQAAYIAGQIRQAREAVRQSPGTPRPVKAVVFSQHDVDLQSVAEHLYVHFGEEAISEHWGRIADASTELSRFRHGCREVRHCPICGMGNAVNEPHCRRILLEVVDPLDSSRRFLIEQERLIAPANVADPVRRADYTRSPNKWRVGDHVMVNLATDHPAGLVTRKSEEEWNLLGAETCRARAAAAGYQGPDWYLGPLSDVHEGPQQMQLVKWQRCDKFHGQWYSGLRLKDASPVSIEEDVFILCLYSDRAHGLDLSFVTHLFLLEPIFDAALMEQVVSRAHRLGATGSVVVETVHTWQEVPPGLVASEDDTEGGLGGPSQEASSASTVGGPGASTASVASSRRHALRATTTDRAVVKRRAELPVICDECFRSFSSRAEALTHESTCLRNPKNQHIRLRNPFDLAAVYRAIRPPPPIPAALMASTGQE